ncbi:MAG: nitrogen fixation protein [Crocosphaera sp.]|nr:nitrogen fixation protein [Crocosphaera sp.]
MDKITKDKMPLCPSARPEWDNSVVFGVVRGTLDNPNVTYLKKSQPVTEELLELAKPVTPTEVFRTAATCVESQCQHFNGTKCTLVQRVVDKLPVVKDNLPACAIRKDCRWWLQEGKSACYRCPQVVTDNYATTELIREVAKPPKH